MLAAVTIVAAEPTPSATDPDPVRAASPAAVPFDSEKWLEKKSPAYMVPITVSADGKWLAVTMGGLVTEGASNTPSLPREGGMFATASEDLAGAEVWVVERETGRMTRPFRGFAASYSAAWSPAGAKLSLAVQDSPTRFPRVAVWSPDTSEPRVFANAPYHPSIGYSAPSWTSDGTRLVFSLHETMSARAPRLVHTTLRPTGEDQGTRPTNLNETLAILDVATGKITAFKGLGPFEYSDVWGFRLSPDGKHAAFLARAAPLQQGIQVNWVRLTVVDLDNGVVQVIGSQQKEDWGLGFSWSPDGRHIAWQAALGEEQYAEEPDKLLIATVGDAPALREIILHKEIKGSHIHHEEDTPLAPPRWTADSQGFWIIGREALLHFAVDGSPRGEVPLTAGKGGSDWLENSVSTFAPVDTQAIPPSGEVFILRKKEIERVNLQAVPAPAIRPIPATAGTERALDAKSSTVFTLRGTDNHGWELMQTSLADGKSTRVALLVPGLPKFESGEIRTLSWKVAEGTNCKGTLLLPIGWKQGDRPPVVMDVYGGDKGQGGKSAEALNDASNIVNPHLFSIRGYAFFRPDMPQTKAEPAASLVRSADAAAEALRASGCVDADRIGIMGQSYGGYTALCALTGSKRFRAGVVANGIYDLFREETQDSRASALTEGGQLLMGATVWEKPQRYLDNSPLYALDKLQTPLLVLQGDGDEISKNQGQALMNSLQRLAKPAEFLVGTDMDHVPIAWSIETQRELVPRLFEFLDRNLKTKP